MTGKLCSSAAVRIILPITQRPVTDVVTLILVFHWLITSLVTQITCSDWLIAGAVTLMWDESAPRAVLEVRGRSGVEMHYVMDLSGVDREHCPQPHMVSTRTVTVHPVWYQKYLVIICTALQ